MDRRFFTVLGVSLIFALVVAMVFYQMTSKANTARGKDASPTDMKDLVVTTRPLGVGSELKLADVKTVKIGSNSFPKGAFSKVEDVLDRPVISNMLQEEPVLDGRLAAKGSGLGLAPVIPVGMRAVSVRVNDVASVTGFVLPGMRVDVLVTGRPPDQEGDFTNTVLQNMLVLSAGTAIQTEGRGQSIQAPTVTLLATPSDAELLTLAGNDGRIQFVLRNSSDQKIEKTNGRMISEMYGGSRKRVVAPAPVTRTIVVQAAAPPPVHVQAPAPPPPPDQIVVIRGNQRTVETMPAKIYPN